MRHFASTLIGGAAVLMLLSGCAKPYSQQVRDDANERYNLVQAQMTFDQARQAYETGQFDRALKQIDHAIARAPKIPNYHVLKGRILLEMNRLEPSYTAFNDAIEIDANSDTAYYFRGIVLQRWSRFDEALESYQAAYDLQTNSVQYLLAAAEMQITVGNYAAAKEMILPRMNFFEHNAAMRQLLGQIALLERDYKAAAAHFSEARLLSPEDVPLVEELARAQFAGGQYEKAYHTVKELQAMTSADRPDLLHLEARCLSMTDRSRDARNIYLRLSQEMPANPDVWIELGNVAYSVGDYRRVALSASRAVALAPDRFEGHLLMGLYEQYQTNTERALEHFQKAAELAPDVAWPHILLGMMHEGAGRSSEALAAYADALRAEPDNQRARHLFQVASETGSHQP